MAETLGLLDGVGELLGELVIRLVRREVESVEARVRTRQPRVLPDLLDAEPLRAVAPHKLGEPADGHSTRPANELQEAGTLLVIHGSDKLQREDSKIESLMVKSNPACKSLHTCQNH